MTTELPSFKQKDCLSLKLPQEAVYIIIPVHNRKATTLECLKNLNECGNLQRYHIAIVDDGSTDGTAEAIEVLYPEAIVLPGDGNLWWTGAMAKGMEYAYQQGAEYFIWLNDDCLPEPETLPKLITFMKAHPNTIAAPTCYSMNSGSAIAQNNGSIGRRGCAAAPGQILQVDGMSGWCVGIPAAVFAKIGAPDAKRFPHYSGDDTYIFRATRAGFKAYLLGDLKVTLVGSVHDKLGFEKYFHAKLTAAETFQALFWNKKSPYRLPTKFFHCIERYGFFLGVCLFTTKLVSWLRQWVRYQLALSLRSKILNI